MNYVYPAVFYEEEGKISVIFPDLGNLATFGDNVADAMRMAGDACGLYLFTALRDGEQYCRMPYWQKYNRYDWQQSKTEYALPDKNTALTLAKVQRAVFSVYSCFKSLFSPFIL